MPKVTQEAKAQVERGRDCPRTAGTPAGSETCHVATKISDIITLQGLRHDPCLASPPRDSCTLHESSQRLRVALTNLFKLLDLGLIKHGEHIGAGSSFGSFPGSSRCLRGTRGGLAGAPSLGGQPFTTSQPSCLISHSVTVQNDTPATLQPTADRQTKPLMKPCR